MSRRVLELQQVIQRLHEVAPRLGRTARFMEVCGTHTVNAFRSGLRSLLPDNVQLLSGPGCPVCVTSQGEIDRIIHLATQPNVILCTYGDMIRVTGSTSSLADARAAGADIRVIYSTLDAVQIAVGNPHRQVVLAAVGFETTTPATAIAILEAERLELDNFTVLASHKCILPALEALLDSGKVQVDGFVCPGHVAVVTGAEVFRSIVHRYRLSCVITGFEGPQIAAALLRLTELRLGGMPRLENLYPQAVSPEGNPRALAAIARVFEPVDAVWRGLGMLPESALGIRAAFSEFDARRRFDLPEHEPPEPRGCVCGSVITGRASPDQCPHFAVACTPAHPIGPCMVSSEGTCAAWFKYAAHPRRRAPSPLHEQEVPT